MRVELIRGDRESDKDGPPGPPNQKGENKGSPAGRKSTRNEELFEQYLQERFDEKGWLKKAGIRFDPKLEEKSGKEE